MSTPDDLSALLAAATDEGIQEASYLRAHPSAYWTVVTEREGRDSALRNLAPLFERLWRAAHDLVAEVYVTYHTPGGESGPEGWEFVMLAPEQGTAERVIGALDALAAVGIGEVQP